MSGFLGILDPPVLPAHLEKLVGGADIVSAKPRADSRDPQVGGNIEAAQAAEMSARVASVVLQVEALTELLKATTDTRLSHDIQSEDGEKTK